MHQKFSQKTQFERSPNNHKKTRICISCGRWFSNLIRERLRIPRTHSETGIHRKEEKSQRRISRQYGFDLENKKMTKKLGNTWSIQGYFIFCHLFETRVQLTCREKNHSLFHKIHIIERTSSEKKHTIRERIGEKPKHLRQKTNLTVLILHGKDGTLCSFTTLRKNSFRWEDPEEALHVVSSRGTVYLWDKNYSRNPKNPGRKKYELRMLFWSSNFGNRELRMVQKTLEICLSETHASGHREVWITDLSHQKVDSRWKGDNAKGMKAGLKEGT